jgi:hypothetical protein
LWSKLSQKLAKTLVKPLVISCPSGTFAAFSKFHLNTSNSTNIKVVQFFEGHNFHVGWHFKFWVEKGEKLGQLQFSLFISALQNPNFAWRSCTNRWEKHRTAFANVVEGCLQLSYLPFCRTIQLFGGIGGQRRVDRLEISRPRSRAPLARRHPAWRPAPRAGCLPPRRLCGPGPTASRHEPIGSLRTCRLGMWARPFLPRAAPALSNRAHAVRPSVRPRRRPPPGHVGRCTTAFMTGIPSPRRLGAAPARPVYKSRCRPILAHAAAPAVPTSAEPLWNRLLWPIPLHANVSSSCPRTNGRFWCHLFLNPSQAFAGAKLTAVAVPACRRPASCMRSSARLRPQTGSRWAPNPPPPFPRPTPPREPPDFGRLRRRSWQGPHCNPLLLPRVSQNRNVKNLDLLYLKIYKSSVANVWIWFVLCYA